MAYIEEELQRRRTAAIAAGTLESTEPILKGEDAIASLDPRDELYKIAEKYRIQKKPVVEGNVTLSATMLTSIPEVDLGIELSSSSPLAFVGFFLLLPFSDLLFYFCG